MKTRDLALGYEGKSIVKALDVSLETGKIISIVGANGSGKSTLLRGLARLLRPRYGAVLLDDQDLQTLPNKVVARRRAILPQTPTAPEGITVQELAHFGRYPHQSLWQGRSSQDEALVHLALEQMAMLELANRPLEALSGGQRQRAFIAMALAQDTPILLLDEPTTHLDLMHQLEVLGLLENLNSSTQKTIIMVLHDLNMAARYSHELIALKDGQVVAQNRPEQVLTKDLLRHVFGIEAHIVPDPKTLKPHIIPFAVAKP